MFKRCLNPLSRAWIQSVKQTSFWHTFFLTDSQISPISLVGVQKSTSHISSWSAHEQNANCSVLDNWSHLQALIDNEFRNHDSARTFGVHSAVIGFDRVQPGAEMARLRPRAAVRVSISAELLPQQTFSIHFVQNSAGPNTINRDTSR